MVLEPGALAGPRLRFETASRVHCVPSFDLGIGHNVDGPSAWQRQQAVARLGEDAPVDNAVAERLGLDGAQARAVDLLGEGPLRVIAGPGTGKTTTVVGMYLHLVTEAGLRPSQVLLLTFASNAAAELKARIDVRYRQSYDESWVSTFHSFATRVLTQFGGQRGVAPFTLMNGFQEKLLMRHVLSGLDRPLRALGALQHTESLALDALWLIGILKQNLIRSDDFADLTDQSGDPKLEDLAAVYRSYWLAQDRLRLWDFRDVIAQCYLLLERDDDLRLELSEKFQHVIVDEYQDVDSAQVKLIGQLTSGHAPTRRLAVVGDPNQSIYSFRGTLPAHLGEAWPFGGQTVQLDVNYRSYEQVVKATDRLLDRYGLRPSGLKSARGPASVPLIRVGREQNAVDEATSVVRQIQRLLSAPDGAPPAYQPGDIAIILRSTRGSGRPFEEALRSAGVPHATGVSPNFAAADVVRFGVSALRALSEPADDRYLVEVLESPFCGLPTPDSRRLLAEARRRQRRQPETLKRRSLLTVLKHTCFLLQDEDPKRWPLPWVTRSGADTPAAEADELSVEPADVEAPVSESEDELAAAGQQADELEAAGEREGVGSRPRHGFYSRLTPKGRDAIHRFTWSWVRLVGLIGRIPPEAMTYRVFQDLGVMAMAMGAEIDETRRAEILGPLRMFLRAAEEFATFQRTLLGADPGIGDLANALDQALGEYVDELEAADTNEGGVVRVLTAHASKGLEFPVVFLPAMASQRFPVVSRARTPLLTNEERSWMERALPDFQPPWPASDAEFLMEEARLGYVAATRAKDMVFLSWADQYGRDEPAGPSAFIDALTEATVVDGEKTPHSSAFTEYTELQTRRTQVTHAADDETRAFLDWEPWRRPVDMGGDIHDSASSISTFLACPRKYYYKSLGLTDEAGVAAARGTAFHDALARFHAPEVEAQWRGDPEGQQRVYRELQGEAIQAHLRMVDGKLEKEVERRALTALFDNYFASEIERPNSPSGLSAPTLATERRFEWEPAPGVYVIGYIDRIIRTDSGHEIADYKTGRGASKGEIERELGLGDVPPSNFQMLIYLLGASEGEVEDLGQLRTQVVGLWYPRDFMTRPPGIRKIRIVAGDDDGTYPKANTIFLDAAALGGLRRRILETLGEIRSGEFPPSPRHDAYTCLSAWGSGCSYAWVCPGRITEPASYEAE